MGCNDCNKKVEVDTISLLPNGVNNDIYNGHFLLKLITFFVLVLAIPLFMVVIIGQIFLTFFFPKSINGVTSFFNNIFKSIGEKIGNYKIQKEYKKREKEFMGNRDYMGDISHTTNSDTEMADVEVYETTDINKNNKEM